MSLTDKTLKNLKLKSVRYEVADRDGMSVRVTPKGKRVFQYRYRINNKQHRIDYGSYPEISLADARKMHHEERALVAGGIDPRFKRKEIELDKISSPTIDQFIDEFNEHYLLKELKRPEKPLQLLFKDVKPNIGHKKVKDVKTREIIAILDAIVKRGSPVQANRTLSAIKTMFNYAVGRGVIESNPAREISKKNVGGKETPKDRFFTFDEIKIFWDKLDEAPFHLTIKLVLKVLLLTGLRVDEVTGARKEEIDYENKIWLIPEDRSKTVLHKVMLTDFIVAHLKDLEILSGDSPFLVQSPRIQDYKPAVHTIISKAVYRSQDHFGLDKWTPHDLRRTVNTGMSEIGIEPYVAEKILNHKMQGIMAVYNHAEYMDKRTEAMNVWSYKIIEIINSDDDKFEEE